MVIALVSAVVEDETCKNVGAVRAARVRKAAALWGVSWTVSSLCAATIGACRCNLRFVGLSVSDGILLSAFGALGVGCRSGLVN